MKTKLVAVAIASALIGAGTVVSMQSFGQHGQPGADVQDNTASMQIHRAMTTMPKMKMTGDVDRDFAKMMVEHHKSAIKMVDIYLKTGKNPALRAMARKMKAAQSKESVQLQKHAQMKHMAQRQAL
ncbi:MAG: DUF305 domain-containing protein [Fimbriimonadaceae bacterium]